MGELERQNALLREANAVLKQALAGVVERYKKLADQLPNAQCTSPRICDVYDEGFEPPSPSVARSLDDITTNVIQAVVKRFAEPSPDGHSPKALFDVNRGVRVPRECTISEPEQRRVPHGVGDTVGNEAIDREGLPSRSMARGVSLVDPSISRGEERRVLSDGSPAKEGAPM